MKPRELIFLSLLAIYLITLTNFCSTSSQFLINPKEIEAYNEQLRKRKWKLRKNIYSPRGNQKKLVFRINTRVKLITEIGKDWLVVRAIPYRQSLEENKGKTIVYLYPLKKKEYTLEDLKKTINRIARSY